MTNAVLQASVPLLIAVSPAPASALFESNKELAGQARISMAEAITIAERTIPGKPVHVELGKDGDHTVYRVEVRDRAKKSRWVYVDTMTGAVTEAKR